MMDEDGQRDEHGEGGEQADDDVHVGDRGHAGDGGEDDDEGGDDVLAEVRGDEVGEDEVENVSAADELIAGDGGVGEEDGDDAEHAGGLVVASFEQIGDGELRELARARRDEVDEQQTGPAAAALPERGEAVLVGVLRAAEQRARADPAREQRKDQDKRGQRAPGDEVVGLGLDLAEARERDGEQRNDNEAENNRVKIHVFGVKCTVWWLLLASATAILRLQTRRCQKETIRLYQTLQVGVCTIGWPALQPKAFWNSGMFDTTPLMRAKPGECGFGDGADAQVLRALVLAGPLRHADEEALVGREAVRRLPGVCPAVCFFQAM